MLEIKMILSSVLNQYDISLPENFKAEMEPFIALRPDKSIMMNFKKLI